MANNFEIIFPRTAGKYLKTEKGVMDHDGILRIVSQHNCDWILAPHPVDDMSSFEHWHLGIHTDANNEYATIGEWFGLKANSVQKVKGQFTSSYALYLVHQDRTSIRNGKTPISPELVECNFKIDYTALIENTRKKEAFDDKLDALAIGTISEFELYQTTDVYTLRKNVRQIQNALITRSKKAMANGKERNMEVVYITGEARCGKSYLARRLCKDNHMTLYETSTGSNPFDDYMGQDAILIDDIRGSDFKFNELLKILDNHMSAKVSARYHNVDLNCKVMYITSIVPLSEFYDKLRKEVKEASSQLTGRIGTLIEVRKKYIDISVLQSDGTYQKIVHDMPNPILTDKDVNLLDASERKSMVVNMFQGIADLAKYAADTVDAGQMDFRVLKAEDENPFMPMDD